MHLWAAEDKYDRFDSNGVKWPLSKCENLDEAERALYDAIKMCGSDPVGADEELSIILHNSNLDVNILYYGQSPLFVAANTGKHIAVEILLRWPHPNPIDVNLRNDAGETPFLAACRGGHLGIVKALMAHGDVDPNLKTADGRSGLWCACHNGHLNVLNWLLASQKPGVIDWETRAIGLKGYDPPRTTTCIEVARVCGHLEVIPIVEEGIQRFKRKRAKERLKRAADASFVTVRIRDADGVFFNPGNQIDLKTEMSRERHYLGDEEGINYHQTRDRQGTAT